MPLYEFVCKQCDRQYEIRRPFSQASDPYLCPVCDVVTIKTLGSVYVAGSSSSSNGGGSCASCGSHTCGSCSQQ